MSYRLLLSTLLCLGAFPSPGEQATVAQFTSVAKSTANQFTAGTLHIQNTLASGTTLSVDNLGRRPHGDLRRCLDRLHQVVRHACRNGARADQDGDVPGVAG